MVEDTTHPIEFLFRLILCKNMDKNYFLQKFAEIFKKNCKSYSEGCLINYHENFLCILLVFSIIS